MSRQYRLPTTVTEVEISKSLINTIVDQKYRIITKLNSTSVHFDVYLANVIGTNEQVSVKIEITKEKVFTLRNEHHALLAVQSEQRKVEEIPRFYWFGTQEDHTFLVCQLLGPSLESLLKTCRKSFTLKTILMLGEQMIKRLEFLHKTGYLHRDIKPQNFCIGLLDNSSRVYLANLGNSKQYKSSKTGVHKLYSEHKDTTGCSKFSSVSSDLGMEPSRRDDLESLIYVLVYFYKGGLPWEKVHSNSEFEKIRRMMDSKMAIPAEVLCRGMPDCFAIFLKYCKELKYEEKPDYRYLRNLLKQTAGENQIVYDGNYDWVITNKTIEQSSRYQFKDMAISFKSTAAASYMDKTANDRTILNSVAAPGFRQSGNRMGNEEFLIENGYDNIIPHDIGISDLDNDLAFPSKALMATVSKSNSFPYPRVPGVENSQSNENQDDHVLMAESHFIKKEVVAYPLPVINDLEEDRNTPKTGVEADSLKQLDYKKTTLDSNGNERPKRITAQYSIILTEENGRNYELEKNGKVSKASTEQGIKEAVSSLPQMKVVNKDREMGKQISFEENEENTKRFSRKEIDSDDEGKEKGYSRRKSNGSRKGDKKSKKTSLEGDKDDKNCEIF